MAVLFFVFFMVSRGITEHLFLFFDKDAQDRQITFKICHHSLSALEAIEVENIYQSSCSGLELMLRDMPFIKSGAYLHKFKLNTI